MSEIRSTGCGRDVIMRGVYRDADECFRACESGDARFDGMFYLGVTSTGIYCRPSCPARLPKPANCRFFPSAAAAQLGGFRACKRCRPDCTPGSPEWRTRSDVVARAIRLIADGVVDREGVSGLASRLHYSERHLNRMVHEELGAGPLALARAQRAQTARTLVETTDLSFADVAFAAGFGSIRQFNDTIREVYASTPSELRSRRGAPGRGVVAIRLAVREPFARTALFAFLGMRALPGVEAAEEARYARSMRLPCGTGIAVVEAHASGLTAALHLDDVRDCAPAVARLRRLFDLDADPAAIDRHLARDPQLRASVRATPGLRVPGAVDGFEMAVRAIVGQQVSVAGARTVVGRIVERCGESLANESPQMPDRLFPDAAAVAEADLRGIGMPTARIETVQRVAAAVADGSVTVDAWSDPQEQRERLLAIKGVGPWTVDYLSMRALGDPDAFLVSDLGVRRGAQHLGIPDDQLDARSQRWRPFRSYAVMHLWRAG